MAKRKEVKFWMISIEGLIAHRFDWFLFVNSGQSCISRIAVAPPFVGLRRFPHGRGFKQWTGDDSKALMKVSLSRYISLSGQQRMKHGLLGLFTRSGGIRPRPDAKSFGKLSEILLSG